MIVRDTQNAFVLTTQDDHARLSGQIAQQLDGKWLADTARATDVLLAVEEHDRAWLRMDETPIWDDLAEAPCDFLSFPLLPKLLLYTVGLDEIEAKSPYAALLSSLHFCSFGDIRNSGEADAAAFLAHEELRRERIRAALGELDERSVAHHFRLLQLCDELSLYICFNRPGASKQEEHPWYQGGFGTQMEDGVTFRAAWIDEERIALAPFPFAGRADVTVRQKHIDKSELRRGGLAQAFRSAPWSKRRFAFVE
ncbi:DUF3891 family protein [Paenibacillus sp. IB182496]|uniref:DUF3891 family protein n=1 Tax=Paenibacillus sabuli TaxID=2772509 RepID=A0A927BYF8_9BACL|nr:DUF3891 family protein [Paenibacillus sabuli]MBD2847719.1 DUF3891 family protein [Paenibacillus sabuli]